MKQRREEKVGGKRKKSPKIIKEKKGSKGEYSLLSVILFNQLNTISIKSHENI